MEHFRKQRSYRIRNAIGGAIGAAVLVLPIASCGTTGPQTGPEVKYSTPVALTVSEMVGKCIKKTNLQKEVKLPSVTVRGYLVVGTTSSSALPNSGFLSDVPLPRNHNDTSAQLPIVFDNNPNLNLNKYNGEEVTVVAKVRVLKDVIHPCGLFKATIEEFSNTKSKPPIANSQTRRHRRVVATPSFQKAYSRT